MKGILTVVVVAGALVGTCAAQAQDELKLANDCLKALEKAPGKKFDAESSTACEKAVAASSDNPELLGMLGAVFSRFGEPERAVSILKSAVALDDVDAMTGLGLMYLYGHGVQQDYVRAAALLVKPAEAGDPLAQNALGQLYETGLGLPQSDEFAIKWYGLAAEQGNERAAANLRRLEQNP